MRVSSSTENEDQSDSASESKEQGSSTGSQLQFSGDSDAFKDPILSFPVAVKAKKAVAAETRGAAALQLFLIIYVSPIELSLRMLNCVTLDNL